MGCGDPGRQHQTGVTRQAQVHNVPFREPRAPWRHSIPKRPRSTSGATRQLYPQQRKRRGLRGSVAKGRNRTSALPLHWQVM